MHELSIAISILEAAEEEAQREGGAAVAAIHVRIGRRSGVSPAALESAYELARETTPLAASRLVVEETEDAELLVTALELTS